MQSFDPAGVVAHNASECLVLQIKSFPKVPFFTRCMPLEIVEHHLLLFTQRYFNKLCKALNCEDLHERYF